MRRTDEGVHVSGRAHNAEDRRGRAREWSRPQQCKRAESHTLPVFRTGGQEQERWCARAVWVGSTADSQPWSQRPHCCPSRCRCDSCSCSCSCCRPVGTERYCDPCAACRRRTMATGRRDAGMRGSRRSRCPHPSPALDTHTEATRSKIQTVCETQPRTGVCMCVETCIRPWIPTVTSPAAPRQLLTHPGRTQARRRWVCGRRALQLERRPATPAHRRCPPP
jgi:hypothetical protein